MFKQIPRINIMRRHKQPICSLCGKKITDNVYDSYCMECEKKELKKLFKHNNFV